MRWTATAVLLAGLLLGPTLAHSAEDAAKVASRALLRQGNERLDKGQYEQALDKFRQAYERFPSPKLFFGEGQALAGLGRNVEALSTFQRFLAEARDAGPEHQAEARQQLELLLQKVGRIQVRCNREGALVRVDGKEQGTTPLPGPIVVEPGEHKLHLEWEGEYKASVLAVVAGATLPADVTFEPKPAAVSVRCNREGALVRLDGKDAGKTPLAAPLSVVVGEHDLVLEYQGENQSRRLVVAEGEAISVELSFADKPQVPVVVTPAAPAPSLPPTERKWYRSPWAWGTGGVLLAGVATTLVLVYGQRDSYPSTNMGTHPIGD
jgi:hypothetical protein